MGLKSCVLVAFTLAVMVCSSAQGQTTWAPPICDGDGSPDVLFTIAAGTELGQCIGGLTGAEPGSDSSPTAWQLGPIVHTPLPVDQNLSKLSASAQSFGSEGSATLRLQWMNESGGTNLNFGLLNNSLAATFTIGIWVNASPGASYFFGGSIDGSIGMNQQGGSRGIFTARTTITESFSNQSIVTNGINNRVVRIQSFPGRIQGIVPANAPTITRTITIGGQAQSVTYRQVGTLTLRSEAVSNAQACAGCGLFQTCSVQTQRAAIEGTLYIDAGVGELDCSGILNVPTSLPCANFDSIVDGSPAVGARFTTGADLSGPLAPCCEFRQYVRGISALSRRRYGNTGEFEPSSISIPNAKNERKDGPCLVEDSLRSPRGLTCSDGRGNPGLRYGMRGVQGSPECASFDITRGYTGNVFSALDEPGFSSANALLGYEYKSRQENEFEFQIVQIGTCVGAPRDVVIARRRVKMCCESQTDSSDPTRPFGTNRPCTENPTPPSLGFPLETVGGRLAAVRFTQNATGILGSVAVLVQASEGLLERDVLVTVTGSGPAATIPGESLPVFSSGPGLWAIQLFRFPQRCPTRNVTLSITVGGETLTRTYDISSLVPAGSRACPADFTCDGQVGSPDLTAYIAAWTGDLAAGTSVAEFDGVLGIGSTDLSAYLNAWLSALAGSC